MTIEDQQTLPRCRGCGQILDMHNDSEAHIIPNALGGGLKPKGIICRSCNKKLDRLADNALIEAFADWPTVLDIPRDRGGNPAKLIETKNGRRVRLRADGSMTAVDVKYEVVPVADGHEVRISAGDIKTIRNLMQKAKKQFPLFDPKIAEQHARTVGIENDDLLKLGFDFSPEAVFGGVVTAIWLFLIKQTGRAFMDWDRLVTCIAEMQAHGGTFRYFVDGLPGLKGPNIELGHKLIARSVPSTGELIAYVEILGILKVGGIFAKAAPPSLLIEEIYVFDIFGKSERSIEFTIDKKEFERQDWRSVGLSPTDGAAVREHFKEALEVFIAHYQRRFLVDPSESVISDDAEILGS